MKLTSALVLLFIASAQAGTTVTGIPASDSNGFTITYDSGSYDTSSLSSFLSSESASVQSLLSSLSITTPTGVPTSGIPTSIPTSIGTIAPTVTPPSSMTHVFILIGGQRAGIKVERLKLLQGLAINRHSHRQRTSDSSRHRKGVYPKSVGYGQSGLGKSVADYGWIRPELYSLLATLSLPVFHGLNFSSQSEPSGAHDNHEARGLCISAGPRITTNCTDSDISVDILVMQDVQLLGTSLIKEHHEVQFSKRPSGMPSPWSSLSAARSNRFERRQKARATSDTPVKDNRKSSSLCYRPTSEATCYVPHPGEMQDGPTGYMANSKTQTQNGMQWFPGRVPPKLAGAPGDSPEMSTYRMTDCPSPGLP
ncbi:uncharacterized protein BJ212DRAFT_1299490 [Suillus subaureus]|uniref:Uncharacterized protein n=1 Tax=Suillus subaureus TaxID=48587 RepID=A0A9P7EB63_9AGAM|nr:uncharacterized protein BJ212DRAFT_1299490 [Suillus subaureus]KAG1816734.1 hypothetical protein BJ212DRAFT_1299490 [Suillus subaureus]